MADHTDTIRSYLRALRDPSSMVDREQLDEAKRQLDEESDPIQRLLLRERIHQIEHPDINGFAEGFLQVAKEWADANSISAKAFAAEGVPSDVLVRAGLTPRRRRGAKKRRSRRSVPADQVAAAIPDGTFTVAALAEASGASPATVRSVVAAQVADGTLAKVGTVETESPGRAPVGYRRA